MALEYESYRYLVFDNTQPPGVFLLLSRRNHFFLTSFMSVTLGDKAVSANHFPRLMFLNKSKDTLSSPTFTEAGSASGNGMDYTHHGVLMWQLQAQRCCLDSPLLSLLPPHSGGEAVP